MQCKCRSPRIFSQTPSSSHPLLQLSIVTPQGGHPEAPIAIMPDSALSHQTCRHSTLLGCQTRPLPTWDQLQNLELHSDLTLAVLCCSSLHAYAPTGLQHTGLVLHAQICVLISNACWFDACMRHLENQQLDAQPGATCMRDIAD